MSNYISLLREVIVSAKLSQSELAKRLGVTFAALNRWLNGHATPRPSSLKRIERLHRELVGYPGVDARSYGLLLRGSARLKIWGIWKRIASDVRLQERLILEHTYHSNAIEGSTLSMKETEAVIFDKSNIRGKSLVEHLEAINHAALLRDILTREIMGPVTEALVRELHARLMRGIRPDAGKYSKFQRAIRGVDLQLTHPEDIPEEMSALTRSWKRSARKGATIESIAEYHVAFESIHPFGDGNGRVGRLIMALQCLEADYPPALIENDRKAEYYEVLEHAQRKDSKPFILFICDEIRRARERL